jgi:hypothetical protein
MAASLLLLRVAATWSVPGLGLLALPDGPTPHLDACPLHTALAIEAELPAGTRLRAVATVEEVTRPESTDASVRGLLLDFGTAVTLPPGSQIFTSEEDFLSN